MKKIICVLSSVLLVFGLASCKEEKIDATSSVVTSVIEMNKLVPEYAAQGKIDKADFGVGANVDEVVNFYNADGPVVDEHAGPISQPPESDSESDNTSNTSSATSDVTDEAVIDEDYELVYKLTIRGLDTGDRIIKMYSYDTRYFYYNASKESGIAYVAYFADNFGYVIGHTTYDDIKSTVESAPIEDRVAEDAEMFFMVQPLVGTKLISYQYDKYILNFFFDENDKLFATTIYDSQIWTE